MEGREELDLAIKSGLKPRLVAFTDSYLDSEYILGTYNHDETEVLQITKAMFDDIAYQSVPENYIAVFDAWSLGLDDLESTNRVVVLDGLEKPGNLGAILRTCSASGIENLIVTESEIDLFNPNVIRNSRGAIFNMNVVYSNNSDVLEYLKSKRFHILCTALDASSKNYKEISMDGTKAFIFGSESKGVSSFWIENSDERIIIPMNNKLDSLNLSVSVGIILFQSLD